MRMYKQIRKFHLKLHQKYMLKSETVSKKFLGIKFINTSF